MVFIFMGFKTLMVKITKGHVNVSAPLFKFLF